MAKVVPVDAAFEGFRIIRDRPALILAWTGFYFLSLMAMVLILLVPNLGALGVVERVPGQQRDFDELLARFGPSILIVFPLAMAMLTTLASAVYRAVLRPDDRSFAYLKFGGDELRLFIMSLTLLVLFTLVSTVYGFLVLLLVQAAGPLSDIVAVLGSLGGLAILLWLGVRLSLAGAMTFAQRRIRLIAAWKQTRGQFWPLLWTLCLTAVFIGGVTILAFLLSLLLGMLMGGFSLLGELASPDLTGVSQGVALALLGQLLVQLAIQVLLIVVVLVMFYAPPCRAELQISAEG